MNDLKQQTTQSIIWNFMDKVGYQVIALLVGIFTVRLLTPEDFGYIGALAVFTALSTVFVESGFTAALVRRKNNTDKEYTAAFIFNVILSIVLYIILFVSAQAIADYYKMPPLTGLAKVIFLALILNSLTIVQNIILTKKLEFRKLTIANLSGMCVSAVITLWMAATGWGYWAIAAQQISQVVVKAILLWIFSPWRPVRIQWSDFKIICEIFSFSFLLIISSTISSIMRYIYNVFIGPRYTTDDLGYYSQANKFHQIPYNVISSSIVGVAYPVLTSLNGSDERQRLYMHKIMRMIAFTIFPVMIGFIAISENFVHVVLTDKWLPILPYFRIMIIGGMFIPFINYYVNLFNVFGKPNLYFITEFSRNALIFTLLLFLNNTIMHILYGYVIACVSALLLTIILGRIYIKYSIIDFILQILPSFAMAIVMGVVVWYIPKWLELQYWLELIIQIAAGAIIYFGIASIFKIELINDLIKLIKK